MQQISFYTKKDEIEQSDENGRNVLNRKDI